LLYVISDGDVDSVFRLDTATGQLFVDGPLDRETSPEYTLNITVLDQVKFANQINLFGISRHKFCENYAYSNYIILALF
jgi:hypothetical protein